MVKNLPANEGDTGDVIPQSRRSPGVGSGNPLQWSCLGNPMDREAWWATVHGVAKSQTRLSTYAQKKKKKKKNPALPLISSPDRFFSCEIKLDNVFYDTQKVLNHWQLSE